MPLRRSVGRPSRALAACVVPQVADGRASSPARGPALDALAMCAVGLGVRAGAGAGAGGGDAPIEFVFPSEEAACVWTAGLHCALTLPFF